MKYISYLLLLISTLTFGCSCTTLSIKESFEQTDAVFIGKVISVDSTKYDFSSNRVFAFTLEIEKDYKRELSNKDSRKYYTTIYTPMSKMFGGCGSYFELNKTYLVYGYKSEIGTITNICTRTSELNLVDKSEFKELDNLKINQKDIGINIELNEVDVINNEFNNYKNKAEQSQKYYIVTIIILGSLLLISLIFNFIRRKKS